MAIRAFEMEELHFEYWLRNSSRAHASKDVGVSTRERGRRCGEGVPIPFLVVPLMVLAFLPPMRTFLATLKRPWLFLVPLVLGMGNNSEVASMHNSQTNHKVAKHANLQKKIEYGS